MAASQLVTEFIRRLQDAENTHSAKHLSELFTDDADLCNLTRPTSRNGDARAKDVSMHKQALPFWNQYLNAFDSIASHFTSIIEAEKCAVLEWHSVGSLKNGFPISYNGVSIVEFDGKAIKAFRTYYDSAAFLPHTPSTKHFSESVGLPELTNEATS